jgi:hypothetical protein
VVEIADVVPHRLFHGLWFYLMILTFEAFALCFLVASAWYLIDMSRVPFLYGAEWRESAALAFRRDQ